MTVPDFTVRDQADRRWTLADHLDAGIVLVTLRGDWWPYCNSQLVSLAQRYDDFLHAGVRIVGINVDPPARNAAMIDKLQLPFEMLSDPDGDGVLKALDVWHPDTAHGDIARPGVFIVHPDGSEYFRQVARDFADRITESELLARVTSLELPPTTQRPVTHVDPEPGDEAMPLYALLPYCRGAKFAAKAMGMRHPDAKDDSIRYVEQMDRYMAAIRELRARIDT